MVKAMLAQQLPESAAVLLRRPRRLADIPPVNAEHRFEIVPLEIPHRPRLERAEGKIPRRLRTRGERQIGRFDDRPFGEQESARQYIFQFPHIARPRVGEQAGQRRGRQLLPRRLRKRRLMFQKVSGQQRDVFAPLPQRGQIDPQTSSR